MFEHLTSDTRSSAAESNWKSPGLDMLVGRRVDEMLRWLAVVSPTEGGFSMEQQALLKLLPVARGMIGIGDVQAARVPQVVECEQQSDVNIKFFAAVDIASGRPIMIFDNLFAVMRGRCSQTTPIQAVKELCSKLECVFLKFIDGTAGSGVITTWDRIRCNGSHLRNFADVGTFIWYTQPRSLQIGADRVLCMGRVVFVGRWRSHHAVVVIQRSHVTAASSAESGPNSSLCARRVILVDEFDTIMDAESHASFRCACVHHDCVHSERSMIGP
jgi:hypothetical protein